MLCGNKRRRRRLPQQAEHAPVKHVRTEEADKLPIVHRSVGLEPPSSEAIVELAQQQQQRVNAASGCSDGVGTLSVTSQPSSGFLATVHQLRTAAKSVKNSTDLPSRVVNHPGVQFFTKVWTLRVV